MLIKSRPHLYLSPDGDPPAGDPPAGNPPAGDKIQVDKAEYDRLLADSTKAKTLEGDLNSIKDDWKHVQRLMKGGGSAEEISESITRVMKREGYSDSQIQKYIEEQSGGTDDAPTPKGGRGKGKAEENEEPDPLEQVGARVSGVDQRLAKIEQNHLTNLLMTSVETAVDSNQEIGKLIDVLVHTDSDEGEGNVEQGRESRLAEVRRDVERETRDLLRARRNRNRGAWDDRWIREEAVNAAKTVYGRYRTLVGDPAKLGRTAETGAGEDRFANKKPVPAPQPKKGMKTEDAQVATRDWAVDQLLRAAHESDKGGRTSV